jgi:hypothetical protein
MLNRRKILGMLGVGVAAGPAAAKYAANAIGQQGAIAPTTSPFTGYGTEGQSPVNTTLQWVDPRPKAQAWWKKAILPEWYEREIRAQTSTIYALDPDIAAKKSWSDSVKIQTQRERNYQRYIEARKHSWFADDERSAFFKENGFHP